MGRTIGDANDGTRMTPIERMARAMTAKMAELVGCEDEWPTMTGEDKSMVCEAMRPALTSLREPTPAMLTAAVAAYNTDDPNGPVWADIWRAMVDCALAETDP